MFKNLRNSWFEMEDNDIHDKLLEINKELDQNRYSLIVLLDIAKLFIKLKKIGFIVDLDKIYSKVDVIIDEGVLTNVESGIEYLIYKEENLEYKEYIEKIKIRIKEKILIVDCEEINHFFNKTGGWGEKLYWYVDDKKFYTNGKFLYLIDIDNLVECLITSKTKDIWYLNGIIKKVYSMSNLGETFKSDYETLITLISRLDEVIGSITGITKKLQIDNFHKQLILYKDEFEKYLNETIKE